MIIKMKNVGITGFEPMITDPESVVFPLYYIPIKPISLLYYIFIIYRFGFMS